MITKFTWRFQLQNDFSTIFLRVVILPTLVVVKLQSLPQGVLWPLWVKVVRLESLTCPSSKDQCLGGLLGQKSNRYISHVFFWIGNGIRFKTLDFANRQNEFLEYSTMVSRPPNYPKLLKQKHLKIPKNLKPPRNFCQQFLPIISFDFPSIKIIGEQPVKKQSICNI